MTRVNPEQIDLAVLGGGPGGYVAAIRAAQLGMRVVLFESDSVGGVCLNWGCIPAKALLRGAEILEAVRTAGEFGVETGEIRARLGVNVDRSRRVVAQLVGGVESLLSLHEVTIIRARARMAGPNSVDADGVVYRATRIILATGARPRGLANAPSDGARILDSHAALELREPPQSLLIVGGGCVGVEFASLYRAYGVEVTLVEHDAHLLGDMDSDTVAVLERALTSSGVRLLVGARVDTLHVTDRGVRARVTTPDGASDLEASRSLVAIGIAPNVEHVGLGEAGVVLTPSGFVQVDEHCQTSAEGIYAIGDVTGLLPLAHVASAQGVLAVEHIAGLDPAPLEYDWMPRAVYCTPQVAGVGLTEASARARGHDVVIGRVPLASNGKAHVLGARTGLVKLVSDRGTGALLGFHAVGEGATELLAEVSVAHTLESTPNELARTVHAHPTLSEVVREAALATRGEALQFFQPRRPGAPPS